jgi:PAS domain S-box-containing protein
MSIYKRLFILLVCFIILPTFFVEYLFYVNVKELILNVRMEKTVDAGVVLAQLAALRKVALVINVMVVLFAGLVASATAKSVSDPIRRLHRGVERIGAGELDVKVGMNNDDEIGRLSRAFDEMVEKRLRAEERLRLQSTAMEHSANGIVITDRNGTIRWVNPAFTALTGYEASEVVGRNPRLLKSGRQGASFYRDLWETVLAGKVWQGEVVNRRKDGSLYTEEMTVTPVQNGRGELTHFIAIKQDVTKRKEAEASLQESEQRYKRLVESVTNYIYTVEIRDGKPASTKHGPGCVTVTGYAAPEFEADPYLWYRMIHEEDREAVTGQKIHAGEAILPIEHRIVRRDGTVRWVRNTMVPKFDAGGKLIACDGLVTDITERKAAEEAMKQYSIDLESKVKERTKELERANREIGLRRAEAEAANRAKSDFLANMSHELRTPLNSILGFSEVLQDGLYGPINEKQKDYVGNIYSSGSHLLSLINDILDLSKVESGKSELDLSKVSLENVLPEAIAMLKGKAMKHGIALELDIGPGAAGEINTDERKLKQIMFNLLSNAVKYTPEGGSVRVSACLTRDDGRETLDEGRRTREEGRGRNNNKEESSVVLTSVASDRPSSIVISVADTGIGIKPGDMSKLFKPFSQVESGYTKTYEGTGLGLALTKRLVEFLGGRIWAESEFGKGSVFTFTIPVKGENEQARE